MILALTIFLGIVLFAAISFFAVAVPFFASDYFDRWWSTALAVLASWAVAAALIAFAVSYFGMWTEDNSRHCVGTQYVQHYNPSTETTEWMCV